MYSRITFEDQFPFANDGHAHVMLAAAAQEASLKYARGAAPVPATGLQTKVVGRDEQRARNVKISDANRQRIIEHGEVFTPPGLVNDMLDLVAHECEREDSRFLEPACGDGNFLAEVLCRRLAHVSKKHRVQHLWEAHALLGVACLYGIELLLDNTARCRKRMAELFAKIYEAQFEAKARPEVIAAAKVIVQTNIVHGDALSMKGAAGAPLVLTQWALVGRGRFKRQLYEYQELTPKAERPGPNLFEEATPTLFDEDDKPVFIARHLRDLPLVHYIELAKENGPA